MPTGYTAAIKDGITFNQYVLTCARAFGALIMMRDDPMDAAIPDKFEPESYLFEWVETAKAEVLRIEGLSIDECRAEAKKEYDTALAYRERGIREATDLRAKYNAMLEVTRAWIPPSPDHVGLKDFMIKQIEESIEWDCSTEYYERDVPALKPWEQWQREALVQARRSLANKEETLNKSILAAESRTKWVRQLRESLVKTST
jgi:hypothetical protein